MTVTIAEVKLLYLNPALTDPQYTEALSVAELIVSEQMRPVCSMSDARYDKVTAYLGAHFAYLMAQSSGSGGSGQLKSEKMGQATETYVTVGDGEYGLSSSAFGQTAISLDTCGILAGLSTNKGLAAQFRVV